MNKKEYNEQEYDYKILLGGYIMWNAIAKVIAHPLGLYILASLLPNVNYVSAYEIITVGIVLAAVAYAFDALFIHSMSYTSNSIIKAVVIGLLVWLSQFVFIGAFVSVWGAVITGIALGVVEYLIIRFARPDESTQTNVQ